MIHLSDQANAQYLFAGDTRSAGTGLRLGNVDMGRFRVYLGILTPRALARIGMPRSEERLGKSASIYLHTLFDGVRGGRGVVEEGTGAPESLAKVLGEAIRKEHEVETDGRFRQALLGIRQFREPQCLAFELTATAAGVLRVSLSPHLRVEQGSAMFGRSSFQPRRPVRIWQQSAFGIREFQLQVT
jgi:hypothetical protein